MDYLEEYYNSYNEDGRLLSRHGQVEYLTTMKYIHRLLNDIPDPAVLEIGAGTGRYSVTLAKEGYRVTAVELIAHNLELLKAKLDGTEPITAIHGSSLDLSCLPDSAFDLTLVLGPMYHLYTREDKLRTLSEAVRVTKPGGHMLVAYCMNDPTVVQYVFGMDHLQEVQDKIGPDWKCLSGPEDLFEMVRTEDIASLDEGFPLKRLGLVAADGATNYMRERIDSMDDETFKQWVDYHLTICERQDLVGASHHTLDVLRKTGELPVVQDTYGTPSANASTVPADEILTDRLILRQFREEDLDDLYEFLLQLKDDEFEGFPDLTFENRGNYLAERLGTDEYYAVVLRDSGKVIGNVYLGNRDQGTREIGYIINEEYRQNGYAREALEAVAAHALILGAHRVYAMCDPRNEASWSLLESAGFAREARLRQNIWFHKDADGDPVWKDTYIYSVLKGDPRPARLEDPIRVYGAQDPFMSEAISEALKGIRLGHGGPFGSVVVKDGEIVGRGHNMVLKNSDSTAHGEISAIRDAEHRSGSHDLSGCVLYTTGEPCPMCLYACLWANIDKVYYGCTIKDNAIIGFRDEAFDEIAGGGDKLRDYLTCIDREACLKLFTTYLQTKHDLY